jgi:hypothetical protein
MGGACSVHGDVRNAFQNFVGKSDGKRSFGSPSTGSGLGLFRAL